MKTAEYFARELVDEPGEIQELIVEIIEAVREEFRRALVANMTSMANAKGMGMGLINREGWFQAIDFVREFGKEPK